MMPFSDACERNRGPILEVLRECLADRRHVLEIGSGTGQHAVYFAAAMRHLTWHPTERETYLPTLNARIQAEGSANIRAPTVLDVSQPLWPLGSADAIFTANTLHIMSWLEVRELVARSAATLCDGGLLCIYGPFRYEGSYTSDSNQKFDSFLKARDPLSGLREMNELTRLTSQSGLTLTADHDLPAYNRLLIFEKCAPRMPGAAQ